MRKTETEGAGIIGHALPILRQLACRHGESAYLTVVSGDEVVFVEGAGALEPGALLLVGRRFPYLGTAAGRVIQALRSRDLWERITRRRGRRTKAQNQLCRELEQIRASGVAVDVGLLQEGITSAAAAVRDYAGKVVCALTLLGPSVRLAASRIEEEIVPSLLEGAELLSQKLGYAKVTPLPDAGFAWHGGGYLESSDAVHQKRSLT